MNDKLSTAISVVESRIESYSDNDILCVILHDLTIEKEDYWVFFYNSSKFVETGNYAYCLLGNAPLIVDKYNFEVYVTGTGHDIEYYMRCFEETALLQTKERGR